MTITYPINLLPGFPGWTTGFSLRWRQEQSTQASGRILVKDMGAPLWTLRAASRTMSPNNLDLWRAKLTSLENGLQIFWGYPMSRCYPILYPNGTWPTGSSFSGNTANLSAINVNRKAVTLSALPAGFVLSVGDYIAITFGTRKDLHQVMETATANGSGVTNEFEIRPQLWPDMTITKAVSVKQPACQMAIVPGSLSTDAGLNGWGAFSFEAIESRDYPAITAVIAPPPTDPNIASVKLLLGFEGADGSTTITDESPAAKGSATISGNAQIDTAQAKFGSSSLLLDGVTPFDKISFNSSGSPATWNSADLSNVTLSLANLRATATGTGGVRATTGRTTGKYYFEQTFTTIGSNPSVGLALATASLTGSPGTGIASVVRFTGNITVNGVATGNSLAIIGGGDVIGIAVDLTSTPKQIWFRKNTGNWNGSGTANPATGVGGIDISSISTGPLFPIFFGTNLDAMTANFGASAFTGAVPSGFSDWELIGPFTIEAWIRISGFGTSTCTIVSHGVSSISYGWWLTHSNAGTLRFRLDDNADGVQIYDVTQGTAPMVANQWYHVAVDRDASNKIRLYVDGVMRGSQTSAPAASANSAGTLDIGYIGSTTSLAFAGWIDELRITKGVARYASDAGFTVPTAAYPRI